LAQVLKQFVCLQNLSVQAVGATMLAKTVTVVLLTLLSVAVAKRRLRYGMREEVLNAAKLFSRNETEDAVLRHFLDRVFINLPAAHSSGLNSKFWNFAGRPTNEGVGVLSIANIDVDMLVATIMNVSEYRGNVDYIEESRAVPDPNCNPPRCVHVYQRFRLPFMPSLHHEILLKDLGERDGWRVLAWQLIDDETGRLDPRQAARFDYNVGAWLVKPDAVAFASSSAPRPSDVGTLTYAILTKGGDATARTMMKVNIKGMVAWSRRGLVKHQGLFWRFRSWWESIWRR